MNETPNPPATEASPEHDLAYDSGRHDAPTGPITCGDAALLMVKVVGIYALLAALPYLARLLSALDSRYLGTAIPMAAPAVILLAIGLFLLIKGALVARWLMPRTAIAAEAVAGPALAQVQAIAFSVVGLVLTITSAPSLVYVLASFVLSEGSGAIKRTPFSDFHDAMPSAIHYGVQVGIGVWLFLGSKGLAAWWWRLRHPEYSPIHALPPVSGAGDESASK